MQTHSPQGDHDDWEYTEEPLSETTRSFLGAAQREHARVCAERDGYRELLMDLMATTDLRKAPDSIKVRLREALSTASSRKDP